MNGDRNGISMNGGDLLKRYRYTPEVLESLARKEIEDRVKLLLYHLRRLGIPENFLFAQDDLIELKNVPKVTRCIATLAKMVSCYNGNQYLINPFVYNVENILFIVCRRTKNT